MSTDQSIATTSTATRRTYLKAIGGAVSTLGLAGCRSLRRSSGQPGNQPANNSAGTPTDVPNDLLEGQTLKMGGMWPIPRDYSVGRDAMRGAQLAVREHNRSKNGVLGANIKLYNRSTGISPAQARKNTRELIVDKGVDVINGGFLGQTYKQMLEPIANNQTLSFFSGGASVPVGEKIQANFDRYKYSFRTCCNMIQARECELNFLEVMSDRMGWDRIAVFTENIGVFDAVAGPLVQGIRDRGIADVPLSKRTSQSIINWNPLFDQAEQENCDLVCANLVLTGMTAARQWGTQERPFDFGGIHLLGMSPGFWTSVGRVTPGLWTMNMGGQDSHQTPRTIPMIDRFEKEFGYRTSDYFTFDAYDAVNMWVDAIKQTGSTDPADLIPYLEERTWYDSVIDMDNDFYGSPSDIPNNAPNSAYPHDRVWKSESMEEWNKTGWLPFSQWQGEKGGDARMVTVAPKRSAGGQYAMKKTPWLR